jgi:arylsulfatase A-like enzyme/Flp pilus assembly protein TadD
MAPRAIPFVRSALARQPADPRILDQLALAWLRSGDRGSAAAIWERLLAANALPEARRAPLVSFLAQHRLAKRAPEGATRSGGGERPKSLLLVTLDTTRADRVNGRSRWAPPTPELDRLARESLVFTEARSSAPVTLPSHASILTGLFPPGTGVRNNGVDSLPPLLPFLPELLRRAGRRTGAFVSSYVLDRRGGLDRGFEVYDDRFLHPRRASPSRPVDRIGSETVARAASWLRSIDPADPFFLWVHLYDPHSDYSPPPPFDQAWADDPYAGEIAFADLAVGRLLAELDRNGRSSDTLVVVTADHGEALGEHGETTHGLFLYDSTLRVPLLVRDPSAGSRRGEERTPVRLVDLFPTVLDRLGLPVPAAIDGVSLGALFASKPPRIPIPPLFAETLVPADFGWAPLAAAVEPGWKAILAPHAELYDLAADPGESRNLLGATADPATARAEPLLRSIDRTLAAPPRERNRTPLDEEAIARLRSLGYLHAGGAPPSGPDRFDRATLATRPDPKERVRSFRDYQAAVALADESRFAEAIDRTASLLATDPGSPVFLSLRAEFRDRAGDLAAAERDWQRAAASAPTDPRFAYLLAVARHRLGRLADAEKEYRRSVALDPRHLLAHYNFGRLLLETGRFDEGERETLAALALAPEHPQARNNLGYVRIVRDRDFVRGIAEIRRAVAASPEDPLLADSLAWALRNAGRRDEARGEMTRALSLVVSPASLPPATRRLLASHARDLGLADVLAWN